MENKLNPAFKISLNNLEERIESRLSENHFEYKQIVPLKNMKTVDEAIAFRKDNLEKLFRAVTLVEDGSIRPYENARFKYYRIDPKGLAFGQTFVLESKILDIMNSMNDIFSDFVEGGISKMTPKIIYGTNFEDEKSIAFYIPPIVEVHNSTPILMDGYHRSTIAKSGGTTIQVIQIENVGVPLAFDMKDEPLQIVKSKPPVNQRYNNFKPQYFRNLAYVGIDG